MSFLRSTTLQSYHLIVPREAAWNFFNKLGYHEIAHFEDLQANQIHMNRPFQSFVKRCDDLLIQIQYLEQVVERFNRLSVQASIRIFEQLKEEKRDYQYFDSLESSIHQKHQFMQDQIKHYESLIKQSDYLCEYLTVLELTKGQLKFQFRDQVPDIKFNLIVGVIEKINDQSLRKLIFRVTRGNALIDIIPVPNDPCKSVFTIIFGADIQSSLGQKINKIAINFSHQQFDLPKSELEYNQKVETLHIQLNDTINLIKLTKTQIRADVEELITIQESGCSLLSYYKSYITKEKQLYSCMNQLKIQNTILIGEIWLPSNLSDQMEEIVQQVHSENKGLPAPQLQHFKSKKSPPTHFYINEFTNVFQTIVNTYGIPRYREINPGLFTIMTFPFLFAVMFADIGHGLVLFLLGLVLMIFKDQHKKNKDMFNAMLEFRYIIVFMGFLSVFCGLIYNEFLSLPINFFGSCYTVEQEIETVPRSLNCYYPFGIDPIWTVSSNSLTFVNSFKMKLSVIIGVIHMLFGILMKGINSVSFKKPLDFFFEFIPQIVFMICTFGYMDFMIVYKWTQHFEDTKDAPSIITILINMALKPGEIEQPLYDSNQQAKIQNIFLLVAFVMVPLMLFPKPLITMRKLKKKQQKHPEIQEPLLPQKLSQANEDQILLQRVSEAQFMKDLSKENQAIQHQQPILEDHEHAHEDSSEIFVHQIIETIEFVLGSISNTASYLRLWALSLAHGQLSEVFLKMTIASAIGDGNIIGMCIGFIIFSMITFAVLMMMDVMECFLHALRLHWVEFQNKFYKGDGHEFQPFKYAQN